MAVCGVEDGTRDVKLIKKSNRGGTSSWSESAGTNAADCYWEVTKVSAETLGQILVSMLQYFHLVLHYLVRILIPTIAVKKLLMDGELM